MKYDFESVLDRVGKDALAYDALGNGFAPEKPKEGFDIIPMWVADMNFATAPSVQKALKDRIEHPLYGYYPVRDVYYDAIIRWQNHRNGVTGLSKEDIGYENGVLGGVVNALSVFCSKGDAVLVHRPTYVGFTRVLNDNGYRIVSSDLRKTPEGTWVMDYEDMEKKIRENRIHAAIFCSPHNPTGRVWKKDEILKAMELFRKYDVMVCADEIWSDLTLEGYQHIPVQLVSEDAKNRTVAFYAPSKTFNLSGLVGSYHIVYNRYLRDRILKESSLCHYNSMNVLSMHALIGAYSPEGEEWADELKKVLTRNTEFGYKMLSAIPGVSLTKPQGTYLLYPDFTEYLEKHHLTTDELLKMGWDVGVAWQDGRPFGVDHTIRMNLALPWAKLTEAFERLDTYVLK